MAGLQSMASAYATPLSAVSTVVTEVNRSSSSRAWWDMGKFLHDADEDNQEHGDVWRQSVLSLVATKMFVMFDLVKGKKTNFLMTGGI